MVIERRRKRWDVYYYLKKKLKKFFFLPSLVKIPRVKNVNIKISYNGHLWPISEIKEIAEEFIVPSVLKTRG